MDLYHLRPSTAPNGDRPPAYGIFPSYDRGIPQTMESSRYERLRGKRISSIDDNMARRRAPDIYPSPQTTPPHDTTRASPTSSRRLQRIGGWLRGHIQQVFPGAGHQFQRFKLNKDHSPLSKPCIQRSQTPRNSARLVPRRTGHTPPTTPCRLNQRRHSSSTPLMTILVLNEALTVMSRPLVAQRSPSPTRPAALKQKRKISSLANTGP